MTPLLPAPLARNYKHLGLLWEPKHAVVMVRLVVRPIQCYSLAAMAELQQLFTDITANPGLVRHFVLASGTPDVFNFGGDLSLFVLLVRARDLGSLKLYARRCIDLLWWVECSSQYGVITTALVQGDTLGGGLESALIHHNVVFERSAQAGFPEVLFNLFPGMGAWQLAIRRGGFGVANDMILSGQIYRAEQLARAGLVDLVVDDGAGEAAVMNIIRSTEPRFQGTIAALQARRLASPVTHESLQSIVDLWAHTCLRLTDRDLRLMERLARAQLRKVGGATNGAIEFLKQVELDTAWDFERTGTTAWSALS